ncbi:hypothetical protein Trydic_g5364 [Trypoxylus dichotomus]
MRILIFSVILLIGIAVVNATPLKPLPVAIAAKHEAPQTLRTVRAIPLSSGDSKEVLERSETAYYPYSYVYPYYYAAHYPVAIIG